jgi:ferric-dicitrate binding protein FerR (iron transport regulator)
MALDELKRREQNRRRWWRVGAGIMFVLAVLLAIGQVQYLQQEAAVFATQTAQAAPTLP